MNGRIGFIGLGTMGLGMGANLVRAGFAVHGYDIDAAKRSAFKALGGQVEASPAAAANGTDRLFVCVFSADEANPLLSPESGVLEALAPGATIVMHTTMAPGRSTAIAESVAEHGFHYLEAPVTGGKQGADDGTLTAIVSGPDRAMTATEPALDAMCSLVYRVGKQPGAALTVKMINQLLVGIHVATTAEAMALAVRAGADPNATFDVIRNGRGNSNIFSARVPNILAGYPEAARTVEIFLKDLGIVLETGRELNMPLPLSASAYQLFLGAAALGSTSDDEPSVVTLYETINGIDIARSAMEAAKSETA